MLPFIPLFLSLLVIDWLLTGRGEVSVRKSILMAAGYAGVAMLFSLEVLHVRGLAAASQFATIFWIEQLLSVDNLLVISLIFGFFAIPKARQHHALLFGIVGAVVFRSIAIFAGTALLERLTWLLFGFALFLIWSGWGMIFGGEDSFDPSEKKLVTFIKRKFGPASSFVAAIVAIEFCDIMFAVDSIPASFSISRDPEVILTANLLAVAGLRSLYHAVAHGIALVDGLEKFIGAVLIFLGTEVFIDHVIMPIPSWFTMVAVFSILAFGILLSRAAPQRA